MRIRFELTGIMPLIMHQDDVEASDLLNEWRKDPSNKNKSVAGDDRSPAWTWQTYLYSDGENVTLPAANLMVAIRQGSTQLILKKQKTYKEISQSGLLIPTEYMDFRCAGKSIAMKSIVATRDNPFAKQREKAESMGFCLFVKRAVIGRAKHVRVRPRFDRWSASGEIEILTPDISFETLGKLFELAGRVGLCDWRPGCKTPGPYGIFETKLSVC